MKEDLKEEDPISYGDKKTEGDLETIDSLNSKIIDWAKSKGLVKDDETKSDPLLIAKQFVKFSEESGELAGSISRSEDKDKMFDHYGDIFITLTISAKQHQIDIVEAISAAYKEIAGRKGVMKNGTFIKSSDLK